MEGKIVYFEKPGPENTEEVLSIARRRADELGIKTIVVSSTRGDTAAKAIDVFKGMKVVAVSHATGWKEPNIQEFTTENRAKFEGGGGIILTATHAFAGVSRAMRTKFNIDFINIVIGTLSLFGPGMKVVCEIAVMAADAGLVRTDEDVIAIAGRGRGADTAIVVQPANSINFFDLKIKEILCKPYPVATPQGQQSAAAEHRHH